MHSIWKLCSSSLVEMMADKIPKILVTGGSGLLGRAVVKLLREEKWNVVGMAYSRSSPDLIKCDLTQPDEVTALVEKETPDFIIHAAAERTPDIIEHRYEDVCRLNVTAAGHLASLTKRMGSKLIYISTDYVFDGTSPPYKCDDKHNPLNKYGQTKSDGEKAVIAEDPSSCILRIPILYGPVERIDESAVTCLLRLLQNSDPKKASNYEKRYPAHVQDIARILRDLISAMKKDRTISGVFQWSGKQQLTKYDMVLAMARVFSLSHSHITPDSEPTGGAPRPYDARMDNTRLEEMSISHHINFDDGIKECLTQWL